MEEISALQRGGWVGVEIVWNWRELYREQGGVFLSGTAQLILSTNSELMTPGCNTMLLASFICAYNIMEHSYDGIVG